jgi:DNA modification methylase
MKIQKVRINQINPAAYNPRLDLKPGDPEYEKLKRSISTFGYVEPLVWNSKTGNLVGGHQRLKILLEQGVKEVEVSVVDLDPEKEKALNLALNKIRGDWDNEKLGELLDELGKSPDFDVTLTGFDIPEISEILDQLEEAKEDAFDFDGEVKKIKNPKTKTGDIIELGDHRILCGDASKSSDLAKLLGSEKVGLIHTDPPYNVDYYGGARPHDKARPKDSKQWDRIYCDNMSQEDYEKWLKTIITNASKYLTPGAAVYIWNGHRQFGPMYDMLTELNFHIGCVITWAKERFAIGYGDYNQQTEFCLYGWKEKSGAHKWYGPNNESTLWEIKRDPTAEYIHPTQKPVAIAHRAIRNSSKRGDIILDMFLGSGTTLIAAESLKRRCFGTEIDPAYCDGIVKRYIEYAGKAKVSSEVLDKYEIT